MKKIKEKLELSYTIGVQKWSSLSNKAVPPRADHDEVYVQKEKTIPTHLYVDIYSSIIHHMQKVETTKMPSNW